VKDAFMAAQREAIYGWRLPVHMRAGQVCIVLEQKVVAPTRYFTRDGPALLTALGLSAATGDRGEHIEEGHP
jgi:hypothetical protein